MLDDVIFSLHDISAFPIVISRPEAAVPGYAEHWVSEMDALIARHQPFVVVFPAARIEETHEDRKRRGLWLKANKAELGLLCLSLITVERDRRLREELKSQAPMTTKAFGIPMEIVSSYEEAVSLAQWLVNRS